METPPKKRAFEPDLLQIRQNNSDYLYCITDGLLTQQNFYFVALKGSAHRYIKRHSPSEAYND